MDVPNRRSSHEIPTPRGGGIGIFIVLLVVLTGLGIAEDGREGLIWASAVALAATGLVGWIDDVRSLGVGSRIAVQVGVGVAIAWIAVSSVSNPFGLGLPAVALGIWWCFWTVATINVVNFMDGIDGLIALQGAVFGFFVLIGGGSTETLVFAVSLAGASLGFLFFNWNPASIFLGDVGSATLGAAMVLVGLYSMSNRGWSAFHVFLPLMPLFADELTTMIHRVRQRERLWVAHREHVYQILVQVKWSHAQVAVLYAVASFGCAVWALARPDLDAKFLAGNLIILLLMVAGLEWARSLPPSLTEAEGAN